MKISSYRVEINIDKHKFVQKVAKKIILLISFGVKQGKSGLKGVTQG